MVCAGPVGTVESARVCAVPAVDDGRCAWKRGGKYEVAKALEGVSAAGTGKLDRMGAFEKRGSGGCEKSGNGKVKPNRESLRLQWLS